MQIYRVQLPAALFSVSLYRVFFFQSLFFNTIFLSACFPLFLLLTQLMIMHLDQYVF